MATDGHTHEQPGAGNSQRLLAEFPHPAPDEWRQLVEKDLKGVPFEKKLVTKTYEGIDIQPLYTADQVADLPFTESLPGFPPYVRGGAAAGYQARAWEICQELPYPTPAEWNQAALHDLERGQTALNLALDQATQQGLDPDQAPAEAVGRSGLSLATLADLAEALADIDLEKTPLLIQAGTAGLPVAALLAALARQRAIPTATLRGCVAFDPLGALVQAGSLPLPLERAYAEMALLTAWAKEHAPDLQTIAVAGHPYHDGGGSAVQELAFTLAAAVEYLRGLQAHNLDINHIAPRIRFSLSVGANFFIEVAKLRAARLLWAQVIAAFGGDAAAQRLTIHVRSSRWNVTALDPYVNMLRGTIAAFAGIAGSCDSLHISPFDEAIHPPDEFSRRIARNTQLILDAEAHLGKVGDPAGGAWYVEALTDALARKAWALFQDVERQGGMAQALQAGFPQQQVAQTAEQRRAALATRKDVLVGVNMYPNLKEKPLAGHSADLAAVAQQRAAAVAGARGTRANPTPIASVEGAVAAALAGATLGEITAALRGDSGAGPEVAAIPVRRSSEPFEALRSAADAYLARTGARPRIFLAKMGPVVQHKARADFATGFFQVGGFEAVGNASFATAAEAAQAAVESGAPVAVLCSTDDTYPDLVPPFTQAVKAARPATLVVLAGYPADQVESHKAAGIDEFIHLRADVYRVLAHVMQTIGVTA